MKKQWKTYLAWILLAEVVGGISGWLTKDAMNTYGQTVIQPPLAPPGWVFPLVWTILFCLMGIGAARIYLTPVSRERSVGLNLFIAQLVTNFLWSPIFFNLRAFGFAFVWLILLWGLVLWMILIFRKVEPLAAKIQIPYFLWLNFAAYLNLGVWYLNR